MHMQNAYIDRNIWIGNQFAVQADSAGSPLDFSIIGLPVNFIENWKVRPLDKLNGRLCRVVCSLTARADQLFVMSQENQFAYPYIHTFGVYHGNIDLLLLSQCHCVIGLGLNEYVFMFDCPFCQCDEPHLLTLYAYVYW